MATQTTEIYGDFGATVDVTLMPYGSSTVLDSGVATTLTKVGSTNVYRGDRVGTLAGGHYVFDVNGTTWHVNFLNATGTYRGHQTPIDMNKTMADSLENGTAQSGGASSITLRAGASAVDDEFKNQAVWILSGTGAGQTNFVSGYVGTTKVATVRTVWVTQPDSTSVYVILGRVTS